MGGRRRLRLTPADAKNSGPDRAPHLRRSGSPEFLAYPCRGAAPAADTPGGSQPQSTPEARRPQSASR